MCNFFSLYRSPSQSFNSLEEFADNLELSFDKISNQRPFFTVVLGDFNATPSNWYDHYKTTYEGLNVDAVTSQFGLKELTKEPIHTLGKSSVSTDLIFTSRSNLVMESDVHLSLHSNCPQQIMYATIHLLTNVKYGTIRRLLLIISERQSNSFLETGDLKI